MWAVVSACKVGGRLIEPGDPLPDLTPEQAERLERARCIVWREPEPEPEPETVAEPEPEPEPQPALDLEPEPAETPAPKPPPRRRNHQRS